MIERRLSYKNDKKLKYERYFVDSENKKPILHDTLYKYKYNYMYTRKIHTHTCLPYTVIVV